MSFRAIASFVMALCFAAAPASASSIGVFFDTDGTDCDAQIPENSIFDIYLIAILGGDAAAAGMFGAVYRLTGNDPAWFAYVTPALGSNLAIGSPIDGTGCYIAWPTCQTGPMVLLHSIHAFSPGPAVERILHVEHLNPPHRPWLLCPWLSLCDADFSRLCVEGGEAYINRPIACTVAVEPATWTQVKSLYTN